MFVVLGAAVHITSTHRTPKRNHTQLSNNISSVDNPKSTPYHYNSFTVILHIFLLNLSEENTNIIYLIYIFWFIYKQKLE